MTANFHYGTAGQYLARIDSKGVLEPCEFAIGTIFPAGVAQTLASAGGTESLVAVGAGAVLKTKGLNAGNAVALSSDAVSVTIDSTQTITGSGVTHTLVKTGGPGTPFVLKDLSPGTGITVGSTADEVTVNNDTTLAGSGTGVSLIKTGSAPAYVSKDLIAGTGISLTPGANDITITNTDVASSVTLTSAGSGLSLVTDGTGPSLSINSLTFFGGLSATQAANDISVANVTTLAGSGTGNSLIKTGTPSAYVTKDLIAGTGITLTAGTDDITVVNSDPASGVTLSNAGTGTSLVSDGAGPSLSNNSISAGSSISLTSASNNVAIAVNVGTLASTTLLSADTTGALTRAGTNMPIDLHYFMVVQDIDDNVSGTATRVDNFLTYSKSAGGGAQKATTMTANSFNATTIPAGTNTDWKNPTTGDIVTDFKSGTEITRSNFVLTIASAAAAGIYWCEFRWIGNYNNAVAQDVMWGLFINDSTKTGIYTRQTLTSLVTRTYSMNGFVTLQNGDTIRPKVMATGSDNLLTTSLMFSIRQYSLRTA